MTDKMRDAFEAWIRTAKTWKGDEMLFNRNGCGLYQLNTVQVAFDAWQAATAAEREACALVCEVNQVAHNVNQGHFLVTWPIDSYGVHEGMTYAAAIRQGVTHE